MNILVAPLNWGLGHATRCFPIIEALIANGYTPILASDGMALELLKKEFPNLLALELPSYNIQYTADGPDFKWKMIKNTPTIIDALRSEKKIVKKWVKQYNLHGIISDNRLGVYNKKVYSIFITHQLNVLSGNTTWLSTLLHQHAISKFDECWVPDYEEKPYLSYKLGHLKDPDLMIKYIGPLSRLSKTDEEIKYDLMVLLSGPEPQRSILEEKLRSELEHYDKTTIFVRGQIEAEQHVEQIGNVTYYNFMTAVQLGRAINQSKIVLCRSGYTTIMDLAKLGKKCFFIPTPGQYEQEYLARKLKKEGLVPYAKQDQFRMENLLEAELYQGLPAFDNPIHWKHLFCLFKGE